jgi:hypothetical protein
MTHIHIDPAITVPELTLTDFCSLISVEQEILLIIIVALLFFTPGSASLKVWSKRVTILGKQSEQYFSKGLGSTGVGSEQYPSELSFSQLALPRKATSYFIKFATGVI